MTYLLNSNFELGVCHHTFTALGRCPRTGRLGISVATSEMGVGGRVPFVTPNIGAVATQAFTDPRLGLLASQLLELGYSAQRVLAELEANDSYAEYRQLGIIDRWGRTAVCTGASNGAWAGHTSGAGWIVMGNGIVGEAVISAMGDAMGAAEAKDIEVRLILALEAGADAGGEPDGQRSAGIVVYENEGFSVINLRVDDHPDPIMELRRLFDKLYPLVPYYRARPDDPRIGTVGDWARARGIDK